MGSFQIMKKNINRGRHALVLKLWLGTKLSDPQWQYTLSPAPFCLPRSTHRRSQTIHQTSIDCGLGASNYCRSRSSATSRCSERAGKWFRPHLLRTYTGLGFEVWEDKNLRKEQLRVLQPGKANLQTAPQEQGVIHSAWWDQGSWPREVTLEMGFEDVLGFWWVQLGRSGIPDRKNWVRKVRVEAGGGLVSWSCGAWHVVGPVASGQGVREQRRRT